MNFTLRDGCSDDHAWIIDTWVKCNLGSKMALDTGDLYANEQKRLIYRILLSRETRLVVAHAPDDKDALLGYVVGQAGQSPVIYYIYVRKNARHQKMACAMLCRLLEIPAEELLCLKVQYSHRPMVPSVKAPPSWRYNPYRNLDADVPQEARTSQR